MQPTIVVIHGIPGTGKTTLARKLSKDLPMKCLGKDQLKEFLFDTLGTGDLAWSQALGGVTFEMLYTFIDAMLAKGESFMLECPFYADWARPILQKSLENHHASMVEIYCTTDPKVRQERFLARTKDGTRHPGHADSQRFTSGKEPTQYSPLKLGTLIEVDTTSFGEADYQALLQQVRAALQ